MSLPHERILEYESERPRPHPHEHRLPTEHMKHITHEDLVDLIETKFERLFVELERIKENLK